jgi:DNA modification methylase
MQLMPDNLINLIYGDILYATGRDFGDYADLKFNKQAIYDFYVPRITEMVRILTKNGSIYLQMDSRISHWIRCICEDCGLHFKNQITWQKRANANNTPTNYWTKNTDTILFFTKSKNEYVFNIQYLPLSAESIKRYSLTDKNGRKYQLQGLKREGYNKTRTLVFNGKEYIGEYMWTQETLDKRIKNGIIIEENTLGELSYRMYLDESKGVPISDLWTDLINHDTNSQYQTQKPINLLARIINSSSNEGDLVADFFAGRGTTGIAAKRLNRKYLLIDENIDAINLCRENLKKEINLFNI